MRMGRYYPPIDALMQFLQSMQLCVEALGTMSRRTKVEPVCGSATSHSSVLHIGVAKGPSSLQIHRRKVINERLIPESSR